MLSGLLKENNEKILGHWSRFLEFFMEEANNLGKVPNPQKFQIPISQAMSKLFGRFESPELSLAHFFSNENVIRC